MGPEANAVKEMFKGYASGVTTLSQLASWLNDQGFRTRNMHRLPDPEGNLTVEPRLFTVASVRGILHNPFYTGKVKHHDQLMPGAHEALFSERLFQTVQAALKRNSGRSQTLQIHPQREYLLRGLIRCAHCGYPIWRTQLHKWAALSPDGSTRPGHSPLGGAPWLITKAIAAPVGIPPTHIGLKYF